MYTIITNQIKQQQGFQHLIKQISRDIPLFSLFGVPDSMKSLFVKSISEALHIPIVFVCKNSKDAQRFFKTSKFETSTYFPSKDVEFQRFDARSREDENQRVSALKSLLNGTSNIVFTSMDALMPKLIPSKIFKKQLLSIETNRTYNIENLFRSCVKLGYQPESIVEGEGTIAKRGSIIDIYVPGEYAYRIDFFDDTVESIKSFDPLTQRTYPELFEHISISGATEFFADEAAYQRAEHKLADIADQSDDYDAIQAHQSFEGIERYFYAFYDGVSLFDYINNALIIYDHHEFAKQASEGFFEEYQHDLLRYIESGDALSDQIHNIFSPDDLIHFAEVYKQIEFASVKSSPNFKSPEILSFEIKTPPTYLNKLDMVASDVAIRIKNGYLPYFYTGDDRNSRVLNNALTNSDIHLPVTITPDEKSGAIIPLPLESGAEFSETQCIIYGEKDIFGFQKQRNKKVSGDSKLDIFTDLSEGDIIVHELHGKGRYMGLFAMDIQGKKRDYVLLEYKDGDKLYIPTEQIDRVQKYIGSDSPSLSKLGGREWESAKSKVSKSVKTLAFDLVSVYSQRAENKGFVFSPDSAWQESFESSFPYQETDGQTICTAEIKNDMESPKVMDRLLLGDVGFGKTEVAMRACFKAIYDQKQTAVLVPTTLLARQHFETFSERFKGFPVKIGQLSRFVSDKERKQTLTALAEGNIDILIGTHAILSPKVKFKSLGLLVIDEEQHFGVGHKEKIKALKRNVDVLTLSATPIPRTLEMSLIGIRDMSMLKTPPVQRKTVKTYVMEYSQQLLERAITREISREGQVYFVCRRISQMDYLLSELKKSCPNARAAIVHGQMNEQQIENIMIRFYNGEIDVLIATTIIESGLDIPNCNTLIVYESDKYGLSQLYQLKGRIGRGETKATCYLTYLKGAHISEIARKRLDAINQNTEFGAGFKIAMKDLEIRGAGNLLGPEQSGHMASVGYDMYCKLMSKAVKEAKGEIEYEPEECSVELAVDAYIPESYISDETVKIEIYKKIAAVKNTDQAKDAQEELKDRFGPIPLPVKNLITTSLIKAFGETAGFALIARQGNMFRLKYAENVSIDFNKLYPILASYGESVKLNASAPPSLIFKPKRAAIQELFTFINRVMRCIINSIPI